MTITTSVAAALATTNAIAALVEAGTTVAAPYTRIYDGTPPASARAALSGNTVLATVTLQADAFQNAVDDAFGGYAKAVANTVADTTGTVTGEASFYRIFDRDNNVVWQGSVTENNAGGDMELSTVNIVAGVPIVIDSFEIRTTY